MSDQPSGQADTPLTGQTGEVLERSCGAHHTHDAHDWQYGGPPFMRHCPGFAHRDDRSKPPPHGRLTDAVNALAAALREQHGEDEWARIDAIEKHAEEARRG